MAEQEIKASINYAAKTLVIDDRNTAINQYENQTTVLKIGIPEELAGWNICAEFLSYGETGFGDTEFITKTLAVENGFAICTLEGAVLSKSGDVFASISARSGDKVWKTIFDKNVPAFTVSESINGIATLEFKDGFVENLVKLEIRLNDLSSSTENSLKEVNSVLPKLRDDLNIVLEEVKEENSEKLKTFVDEKFSEVDSYVGVAIANTNQSIHMVNLLSDKLSADAGDIVKTVNTYISTSGEAVNKLIDDTKTEISGFLSDSADDVDTLLSNSAECVDALVNGSVIRINKLVDDKTAELDNLLSGSEQEVNSFLSVSASGVNKLISDSKEEFDNLLSGSEQEVNSFLSASASGVNKLINDSKLEIENTITNAENRINELSAVNENRLDEFEEYLSEIDSNTQEKLSKLVTDKTEQLDSDLGQAIATANQTLSMANQLSRKLENDAAEVVYTSINNVNSHITSSTATINTHINNSTAAINEHISTSETAVNNCITAAKSDVNKLINDSSASIDEILGGISDTNTGRLNEFENYIISIDNNTQQKVDKLVADKTAQLDKDLGQATATANQTLSTVNQLSRKLEEDAASVISTTTNYVNSHISSSTATINDHISTSTATINEKISTFTTAVNKLISDSDTEIDGYISSSSNTINDHINTSTASINSLLSSTQTAINNHINVSGQSITQMFSDLNSQGVNMMVGKLNEHPFPVAGYSKTVKMRIRQSNGFGRGLLDSLWTTNGKMMFIGIMIDYITMDQGLFFGTTTDYALDSIKYVFEDGEEISHMVTNAGGDCVLGAYDFNEAIQTVFLFDVGE